jgi:hypothetical protein
MIQIVIVILLVMSFNIKAMYVTNLHASPNPKTFTISEFIQDENMLEYLDNVFESVQFPKYNDKKHENHYHHTICHCNGCYIENECLEFLRQHICEKIKGTFCDS